MATFRPNHAGIRAMEAAPFMVEAMRRKAVQAETYAIAIAPVDTGNYKSSFHVTAGHRDGKAYGRLSNDATSEDGYPYCQALEYGTSKMRAQRIIQRSIDALRTT